MKKLLQENGPTKIWIQTWLEESGEAAEPYPFNENDDWTAQLFNYYFLSGFSSDGTGQLDANHRAFPELKEKLDNFFQNGELSGLHASLTEDWAEASGTTDEDAFWFSAAWDNFQVDEYEGPALGFYFARERSNFLNMNGAEPIVLRGLPLKKPEFGCLIYPDGMDGYHLYMNEPGPSVWSSRIFPFLRQTDDAYHAKEFFKMCKSFSEDVIVKEQHQPREQQVSFLSDSLQYTSDNKAVNFENFKQEVLKEPAIIDAFDQYQEKYTEQRQWNPPDQFAVTDQMQNQAKKFVKSVIKLDKNFHIYVHGNKERIEKGFDENRKLHYYQLWFDAEV
jgi:hypothetical protein